MKPSIIIIIECKDYKGKIPVDDIEEFHSKIQQIGAHKGIVFTKKGAYQEGAMKFANAKNIGLARVLPSEQIDFMVSESGAIYYSMPYLDHTK